MSGLVGVAVVVTAPASSRLGAMLRAAGAEVIECPTIAIGEPTSWDALDTALQRLRRGEYEWLVFTSKNGVEAFFGRSSRDEPPSARIAAVGDATAARLRDGGIKADVVPEHFTAKDLAAAMGSGKGRVLAIRGEDAPRQVIEALEHEGWKVDDVAGYRTVPGKPADDAIELVRAGGFGAITFTSGSTAANFVGSVGPPADFGLAEGTSGPAVACIGPETAEVARSQGFRVDVVADPHTNAGLVSALSQYFSPTDRGTIET